VSVIGYESHSEWNIACQLSLFAVSMALHHRTSLLNSVALLMTILDGGSDLQTQQIWSFSDRSTQDRWTRFSSSGGTHLEQFATFRLVVSINASIQVEIEDRHNFSHAHTLPLQADKHFFVASMLHSPLLFFRKVPLELNVSLMALVYKNNNNNQHTNCGTLE